MKVKIRYFAGIKDVAGLSEEFLEIDKGITFGELKRHLLARRPQIAAILDRCRIAQSQRLVNDSDTINSTEEIAILPPISGG